MNPVTEKRMDPMKAPILVIRNLVKYLDDSTKKEARLVSTLWEQKINEEGELRIKVSHEEKGNWEFVKSIRKPSSICFERRPEEYEKLSVLSASFPLRIHFMCESDAIFLKKQLSPPSRAILTELVFSDDFLWRSELITWTEDLRICNEERCYLPSLQTLRFTTNANSQKVSAQWRLDYNTWGSTSRKRAQRNIQFILNMLLVPSLKTYISESVCCSSDNDMKDIKSLVAFFHACSQSLKTIKMNSQRSDILRNYKENSVIPKLDELRLCMSDVDSGLNIRVFNIRGYWGKLLNAQSTLKKIHWEYLDFVPQDFLYSVILANEDTLEDFHFSCAEHNTRMIIIEPIVKIFDCNVFRGCHLKKLSLRFDWEILNIQTLPKTIETLILHGCLMTNENLFKLDLPTMKSIEMSRNIFSTGHDNDCYEIKINTFQFLLSIRSLDSLFIEKLKEDLNGPDRLESYFKHLQGVSLPIPDDKFFPDHFVSIKL